MITQRLADFCTIVAGGRRGWSGLHFVESGFPAFGAGGMNGFLPEAEFAQPGIVLSSIGARCGKCFIAAGQWSSLANTQLIFPDPATCDVRFLWYQLNDEARWPRSGTAQPFIKPSAVKSHQVFLPPIEEQRRSAAVLDAADALRTKRRQALAKLDTLTQSIFIDMFGHPRAAVRRALPSRLGDCVHLFSGSTLPAGSEFAEQTNGYALVKVSDLARSGNDKFLASTREWTALPGPSASTCPPGSVVFPKRGGAIATNRKRVAVRPSILDPNLMGAAPREESVTSEFLFTWFSFLDLESIQSGSSVPQLNKKDLEPIPIVVPGLAAQERFSEAAAEIDRGRLAMASSLDQIESLFASLQQRVFRGEL